MRASYFVIFNRRGIDRVTRSDSFTLKGGEYAQQVDLVVDDRLFEKVKVPSVTLHVGGDNVARMVEAEVDDEREADDQDEPTLEAEFG